MHIWKGSVNVNSSASPFFPTIHPVPRVLFLRLGWHLAYPAFSNHSRFCLFWKMSREMGSKCAWNHHHHQQS